MPAIRDYTTNFNSAGGTTLTIDTPVYAQNDLLLAILCADTSNTAAGFWSLAGWSILGFSYTGTSSELSILYKIAGAGEASSFTFTRTVSETLNGGIIAIRDINTTAPFGGGGIVASGLITMTVAAAGGTFTRSAGSFLTDGFAIGQTIMTCGFANAGNNTTKVITNVIALVITVNNTGLVNEGPLANTHVCCAVGSLTTQAASARYAMSSITTTVNNSMLIYAASNASQNGSPSFIDGPACHLYTIQGGAESSGVGWAFLPPAGASDSNIYCTSATTGVGHKLTLQIAPPSGGATVIPTYNPADSSVYIDPINGTTAFNTNAAFSANATTPFGVTINGRTLANGTVSADTDYGLNPTNSVGGLTTSAANNWSGATTALSGGAISVTGKNIITHTGPATPLQYQRLKAAAAGLGIGFGMYTSNNNFKIWHVFGSGTSYGESRDVPIIINSGNTTGVIQSTGTLNAASVAGFGYFVASQATTSKYQFYSLWVLDTLTIAGGNSTEPITIISIVATVNGHEHRGAIIQAANQMILAMPLQFGNGGTDAVYLDLDSTAIEFPKLYDQDGKKVTYCSTENIAGITYYPGASDTIKHRNSIISSPSKYHWKFHSSASTSATYDFDGLTIIGAGTITLKASLPLSGITWQGCDSFDTVGAYLTSCIVKSTVGTTAITVTSTTYMDRITDTQFISNARAITLSTAGTYASVGNTFTTNTYDFVNSSTATNVVTQTDTRNTDQALGNGTIVGVGESFTGNGGQLANAVFTLSKTLSPTGNATAKIYAHTGTYGTSSLPTGTALASSQTLDVSTLTGSPVATTFYFIGANNITLTNSTKYVVTLEYSGGNGTNYVNVGVDTTSPTFGGNFMTETGSTWTAVSGTDAIILVRTGGIVVVNATSGSNPTQAKALNTGSPPGSITINTAIDLVVSGVIQNTQCWIYTGSTEYMNMVADATGTATITISYPGDTAVTIRAREMGYLPFETTGTITDGGLAITAVWQVDPNWKFTVSGINISFANPTTITRASGNFTTDGWLSIYGQVTVDGSVSNDGTYTIASVGTTTLTISGATLTTTSAASGVTLTFTRIALT